PRSLARPGCDQPSIGIARRNHARPRRRGLACQPIDPVDHDDTACAALSTMARDPEDDVLTAIRWPWRRRAPAAQAFGEPGCSPRLLGGGGPGGTAGVRSPQCPAPGVLPGGAARCTEISALLFAWVISRGAMSRPVISRRAISRPHGCSIRNMNRTSL